MKSARPIWLALILVGVFYFVTTHRNFDLPSWVHPESSRAAKLEITEADKPLSFDSEEQNNIALYKRVLPSVVNITSTAVAFDFFYGPVPQEGQGSGFIIDKEGHILTNYHVVANARQLEVTLSNRKRYRAETIGVDPSHDLAVIRIAGGTGLAPATLGDSKSLVVGQKVYAIGNPFGLSGTMTRGIISSLRSIRGPDGTPIDEAIQTDAAINPGNSGGPMLNSRGEVIGINSQIATGGANQSAGIGFAIPINAAKAVLNDLVTVGRVRRPSLGIVRPLPVSPELAQEIGLPADYGVLIMQVVPGGAAERAGLRGGNERAYIGNTPIMLGGDLIVAIDGQEVNDLRDLSGIMNNHRMGDTVKVTIYRGKKKMDVTVSLGEARQAA
ncbi:MAG: DegP2 peptidase [Candidatus Angelobacter sp.]|jgi:S1-C subfamily serine protease|nr:DegP2 peptidase [Candidatus Angelobacter sp.]